MSGVLPEQLHLCARFKKGKREPDSLRSCCYAFLFVGLIFVLLGVFGGRGEDKELFRVFELCEKKTTS